MIPQQYAHTSGEINLVAFVRDSDKESHQLMAQTA